MRIFFIPGLGEDTFIFDKIEPFIQGEKIFIDNWSLLGQVEENGLQVTAYAEFLIRRFSITQADVVIGHSLGGWVALHIKNIVGCPIVQIASWTDMKKVFKPANRHVMYWAARKGVGLNSTVLKALLLVKYKHAASREIFTIIFKRIMAGDKNIFTKQLEMIFNPYKRAVKVEPDLRIHAKSDEIVRPPDQPFIEVPGDHFTLYTYPDKVYKPIVQFLATLALSRQ
jgi:hypothetical protein